MSANADTAEESETPCAKWLPLIVCRAAGIRPGIGASLKARRATARSSPPGPLGRTWYHARRWSGGSGNTDLKALSQMLRFRASLPECARESAKHFLAPAMYTKFTRSQ